MACAHFFPFCRSSDGGIWRRRRVQFGRRTVHVPANSKTDKTCHYQPGSGYHQPMRIFHLGELYRAFSVRGFRQHGGDRLRDTWPTVKIAIAYRHGTRFDAVSSRGKRMAKRPQDMSLVIFVSVSAHPFWRRYLGACLRIQKFRSRRPGSGTKSGRTCSRNSAFCAAVIQGSLVGAEIIPD